MGQRSFIRWILCAAALLLVAPLPARAQDDGGLHETEDDFTPEQQAIIDEGAALAEVVQSLFEEGRFHEALPKARKVLDLYLSVVPDDHDFVGHALSAIGAQHMGLQQWEQGEERTLRAIAILERTHGPDDSSVATAMNNMASCYLNTGRVEEGIDLMKRVLAIAELEHGPDSTEIAHALRNCFVAHLYGERYIDGLPYLERLIPLMERSEWDRAEIEMMKNFLSQFREASGNRALALATEEKALRTLEERYGPTHTAIASTLNRLSQLYTVLGRHDEAVVCARRSMAIYAELYGDDARLTALEQMGLCSTLNRAFRYEEAEPEGREALVILDQRIKGPHQDRARARYHLASSLQMLGRSDEALPLLEEALQIFADLEDSDPVDVSGCLGLQALVLQQLGSLDEAVPLYRRARDLMVEAEYPNEFQIMVVNANLAIATFSQGEKEKGRDLLRETARRAERELGKDAEQVLNLASNLAAMETALGNHAAAAMEVRTLLDVLEDRHGPDHPMLAFPLGLLAEIREAQGKRVEARDLRRRHVALLEDSVGRDHPDYLRALGGLVARLGFDGDHEEAAPLAARALDILEARFRSQFTVMTNAQRNALKVMTRPHLSRWVVEAGATGQGCYDELLRFKGLVPRVAAAERRLEREIGTRADARFDALREVERDVARLANAYPRRKSERARWRKAYAAASAERERLAAGLAADFAPLREGLDRMDLRLADIQAALRPGEVLVDFLLTNGEYVAWLIRKDEAASAFPIRLTAAAEAFDIAVADFARRSSDPATAIDDADWLRSGRAVSDILLGPVLKALPKGTKAIVFCPDAALSFVPFGALPVPGSTSEFLIDRWEISCVAMAQDLVPFPDASPVGEGALVVGAVDYATPGTDRNADGGAAPAAAPVAMRSAGGRRFAPLPQTAKEIESVAKQLGAGADVLAKRDATEARIRDRAGGKRHLHVATHGFVRDDLMAGLKKSGGENEWLGAEAERRLAAGFDPLLLAGLALAGAGTGDGGEGDDGILTAAEVSHMDLRGVELVTLSACDTARGHVAAGDGVVGLVQAFQMAGAHHVLASLWPVDDEATRLLMEKTYAALLADGGTTPAAALRKAALAVRGATGAKGRAFAGPAYWAAFGVYRRE